MGEETRAPAHGGATRATTELSAGPAGRTGQCASHMVGKGGSGAGAGVALCWVTEGEGSGRSSGQEELCQKVRDGLGYWGDLRRGTPG